MDCGLGMNGFFTTEDHPSGIQEQKKRRLKLES
jgi:hypothetical protein